MIDYSPLWETLKKKELTQYSLIQLGIDKHTLDSLRNNRNITLHTLEHICDLLECEPNDVICFKK